MSSEDAILQQLTRMTAALESMTSGVSSATDATRNFTEGLTEADKSHAEAKAIGDAANKRTEKATNEAIRSVASFSKALTSGAEGGFSKFSGGVESAAQSMATLVASHGKLGQVVANLTLASGKLLTLQMKQADDILAASDNIKKLGFAGDLSTQTFFDMAQNAKTSSAKLAEAMKRTQGGLITFGDDFGKGAAKFGEMITVTDLQREAFQRLGVTQEDLMGSQADYIALQKASGHSMSGQLKDTKKLNQASLEYVENLVKLGKLTGKDIDQVKQAQLAAREAYEEKVLVRKEEIEIAALRKKGLNDAADDLLNQQKRRQEFLTLGYTLDKELGAMLAKVIRTEAFDSTTTGLSNVGVEAGKLATDLKNAKTAEEVKELFNRVAETITNGTDRNVQDLNAAVQHGGEALGKKLGIFTFVFDKPIFEIGQTADKLNDVNKKISDAIGNPANPTKPTTGKVLAEDPAEIARNYLTTILKNVTKTFQDFLYETNPLLKGLTLATGAASGLAIVAGGAAAVLTAKTGIKAAGSLMSSLGGVFGKGAPAAATAATAAAPAAATAATAAAPAAATAATAASTAAKPGFLMSATDKIAAKAAAETAKTAASTATVAAGEAALKTAGATAGKSMLKALPVVGSILSVASAFGRISSGDYIGAALEGGAAVAALVPGPGTAVALALTGAAGAKDVYTALNPDLAKVPESVPAETSKTVTQPTAPEVPRQTQVPGEAGRGAASSTPTGGGGSAPAPAASTASRTAGTMGDYKSRAAAPAVQGGSGRGGQGGASFNDMSALIPDSPPPPQDSKITSGTKPTAALPAGGSATGLDSKGPPGGKFKNKDEFVKTMWPWAQYVSSKLGAPALGILGQWGGETGGGTSLPSDYNYAGIKAGDKFAKGDYVLTEERYNQKQLERAMKSGESLAGVLGKDDTMKKKGKNVTVDQWYGGGKPVWQLAQDQGLNWVQVKSYFAKFNNLQDFADGYVSFLKNPRYAEALKSEDAASFGESVAKAGYATADSGTYSKKVANFAKNANVSAANGGIVNGPSSGYPATLHGNEIITPLSPNSILEQLGKTPATTEIAGSSSSSTSNTIKEIYSMNTEVMEMLAGKLDTMISKLSDSNDTQSKLLMYSRV